MDDGTRHRIEEDKWKKNNKNVRRTMGSEYKRHLLWRYRWNRKADTCEQWAESFAKVICHKTRATPLDGLKSLHVSKEKKKKKYIKSVVYCRTDRFEWIKIRWVNCTVRYIYTSVPHRSAKCCLFPISSNSTFASHSSAQRRRWLNFVKTIVRDTYNSLLLSNCRNCVEFKKTIFYPFHKFWIP